jgi:hypothetical protein
MPTYYVYTIGMIQYTIRKIPDYIDRIARDQSKKEHKSLNKVLLEALSRGLDANKQIEYHDMDDLAGTWVSDPAIDAALDSFNEIDEDLWQ